MQRKCDKPSGMQWFQGIRGDRAACPARVVRAGALALAMLAGVAQPADEPRVVAATVTRVNDGDSLEVDTDAGHVRVRLSGVDTPEYDQPYGDRSSAFVKALVPVGAKVELEIVTQDQFKRAVAVVWLVSEGERINLNERLLREGHAWAYRRYLKGPRYCELEAEARGRKSGLWAQPVSDWVYPPEWRFLKNGEIRALPAPYEETKARCLEVMGLSGAATYAPPN